MAAVLDSRVVDYRNKCHLLDDIRLGVLMDELQGEDHKRLALIVDLRVGALEKAVERVADSVSDIKESFGELRGVVMADRDSRKEIVEELKEVRSKLDSHLAATSDNGGEKKSNASSAQHGWNNPAWLASITGLLGIGVAVVLALGHDIVEKIVNWWVGGE